MLLQWPSNRLKICYCSWLPKIWTLRILGCSGPRIPFCAAAALWGRSRCSVGTRHTFFSITFLSIYQKNPRTHKNKIGTPPPPNPNTPPPKTRNFMDMAFPAEQTHFFQASIKLVQPFPAPELRTRILRTRGFFLKNRLKIVKERCQSDFRLLFNDFARPQFSGPLWGALIKPRLRAEKKPSQNCSFKPELKLSSESIFRARDKPVRREYHQSFVQPGFRAEKQR